MKKNLIVLLALSLLSAAYSADAVPAEEVKDKCFKMIFDRAQQFGDVSTEWFAQANEKLQSFISEKMPDGWSYDDNGKALEKEFAGLLSKLPIKQSTGYAFLDSILSRDAIQFFNTHRFEIGCGVGATTMLAVVYVWNRLTGSSKRR